MNQLTHEIRQALIRQKKTQLSRILDKCFEKGLSGQDLTVKEICLSTGLNPKAVYKVKKDFFSILSHSYTACNSADKSGKKSPHREAMRIHVPTLEELEMSLGIISRTFTKITADKPAQYRAEVHAEKIRRRPGTYSRISLSKPLGISARTSRRYDKLAGIEVTPNHDREPLTTSKFAGLPETYRELLKSGKSGLRWLETPEGKRYGYTQNGAIEAIKQAGSIEGVTIVTRLANHYKAPQKEAQPQAPIEKQARVEQAEEVISLSILPKLSIERVKENLRRLPPPPPSKYQAVWRNLPTKG